MSPMRSFLKLTLLFVALQVPLSWFWFSDPRGPGNYFEAFGIKGGLLRDTPSPRIVFAGGSNVAFGVDSVGIATELQMNPVNMGLHAAMGLPIILAQLREGLRHGDVVVMSLEYDILQRSERLVLPDLISHQPAAAALLSLGDVPSLLDYGLEHLAARAREHWQILGKRTGHWPPYSVASFNQVGDVVAHYGMRPDAAEVRRTSRRTFRIDDRSFSRGVGRLQEFEQWCHHNGVKLLISYPAVTPVFFRRSRADLERAHRILAASLESPIIDRPEDLVFPMDHFFDTRYHLSAKGTARRSRHLTERLSAVLSASGAAEAAGSAAGSRSTPGRSRAQ